MKLSYIIKSNNIRLRGIFTILFFLCCNFFILGQSSQTGDYQKENIIKKSFNKSKWSSLKKELNYWENKPIYNPKKRSSPIRSLPFAISSIFVKSAFFIVAIGALVFVGIKLFASPKTNNKPIINKTFSLENIEESIHEVDLEGFLKQAIASKDYRQAIRLYYLIIIRNLSNKKFIFWKKDKTNYEYLTEMKSRSDFKSFKELTDTFEIVWYSGKQFQENQYDSASKRFEEYIENLKNL